MKHLKCIHTRIYSAKEIGENQFEVVEPISSGKTFFDRNGGVIDRYAYQDDCGMSITGCYQDGLLVWDESEVHRTDYKYDEEGNLVSYVCIGDHGKSTFMVSHDEDGHTIEELDSSIEEECFKKVYDGSNLIKHYTAYQAGIGYLKVISYEYDDRGNEVKSISEIDSTDTRITTHVYDDADRLMETKIVEYSEFEDNVPAFHLEKYSYKGDSRKFSQKEYYSCSAAGIEDFLEGDDFTKAMVELSVNLREESIEGSQRTIVNSFIANDTLIEKDISIEDVTDGCSWKTYEVDYSDLDPVVTERIFEYWDENEQDAPQN